MAKPARPRDVKQLATLILDITTGERPSDSPNGPEGPATAARRDGGLASGKARAKADHAWSLEEIAGRAS